VILAFAVCVNNLTLSLDLETIGIGRGTIWPWMVPEVVVAVVAELT